jgi:hypothetical protein
MMLYWTHANAFERAAQRVGQEESILLLLVAVLVIVAIEVTEGGRG